MRRTMLIIALVVCTWARCEAGTVLTFARTGAAAAESGGVSVPIKLAVDTVGNAVSKWGVSTIPWGRMANMAGWVAMGYGIMQATRPAVISYLADKALGINDQGQVTKAGSLPDGIPPNSPYWLKPGTTGQGMGVNAADYNSSEHFSVGGIFLSQAAALAAGYNGAYGHSACLGWSTAYWGSMGKQTEWGVHTSYEIAYWPKEGNTTELVETSTLVTTQPANLTDIINKFLEDLGTSTGKTAAAQSAAVELLRSIDARLAAEFEGAAAPNSQSQNVKDELHAHAAPALKTAVEEANQPSNYAEAKQAQQPMEDAVHDAMRKAQAEDNAGFAVPADLNAEEPTAPEKKEIGGVLDTFMAGIRALPVVSWLTGFQVHISGSSILSIPNPMDDTTLTVDFAEYDSTWALLGNMLYSFCCFRWVMYLFEG